MIIVIIILEFHFIYIAQFIFTIGFYFAFTTVLVGTIFIFVVHFHFYRSNVASLPGASNQPQPGKQTEDVSAPPSNASLAKWSVAKYALSLPP